MGGVVKAIKKAADTVVHAVEKVVKISRDLVDLAKDTLVMSTKIIYDTVVKGESFKKTISKQVQEIGNSMGNVYNSLFDDALGIDDGKFLGISGGVFAKLGQLTKDFYHDHATETVGIGIIVALIIASILFPPAYGVAGAVTLAAFEAGVTSTIALMTVYYATLGAISLGVSIIVSGVIDGAVLAMYPEVLDQIFLFEQGQETLRIAALASILDGSIYDRLAGGWMYDSQFAGSVYYDATTPANLNISVGGEFSLTSHAINTQFGYQDSTLKNLAGDENFSVLKM